MTAVYPNDQNGATGFQTDGFVYPQFIGYAKRAPTTQDIYNPGTRWQDNSVNPPVIYETTGGGTWASYNTSGSFTNLTAAGTVNLNASGSGVTTIGTGGTGAVAIGNATGNTAITGAVTISGNETFGSATVGVINVPATASGASPQTVNGRTFSVTFTGVSIAAGATQSFTIANSVITGASTVIQYTLVGCTTGAALTIESVTNSASQSVVVVGNGTGATTSIVNITLIGTVLN